MAVFRKGLSFVPALRGSSRRDMKQVTEGMRVVAKARGGNKDFLGIGVILELLRPGQELSGMVTQVRPDGVVVDIGAAKEGFVPIGHISQEPVENIEDHVKVGQIVQVWLLTTDIVDGKVDNFSLTMIHKQGQAKAPTADMSKFEGIPSSDWLTGKVNSIESYGAFVSVTPPAGGPEVKGLVHITQIRDKFVDRVQKVLSVGQEVQVRVLSVDMKKKRLSLTMRTEESIANEGSGGDRQKADQSGDLSVFETVPSTQWLTGKVAKVQDFGAIVSVAAEPGGKEVQGLVHYKQIKDRFVVNIADELSEGQEVQVRVLKVDVAGKRLSLTMKNETADGSGGGGGQKAVDISAFEAVPWSKWLTGKIEVVQDYGALVSVAAEPGGEEAVGLVPKGQTKDYDTLAVGQEVQVRVLTVDPAKKRLRLTMRNETIGRGGRGPKARAEDLAAFEAMSSTEWLTGKVASVQDYGAFVAVAAEPNGKVVQGLVHVSEMKDGYTGNVSDVVSKGQEVKVRVIKVDKAAVKLDLSMRDNSAKKEDLLGLQEFQNVSSSEWLTGRVKNLENFGVFLEVASPTGNVVDGLLHITQIRDGYIEDVGEEFEVGQDVKVRIRKVDLKAGRMSLTMLPIKSNSTAEA